MSAILGLAHSRVPWAAANTAERVHSQADSFQAAQFPDGVSRANKGTLEKMSALQKGHQTAQARNSPEVNFQFQQINPDVFG